MTASYCVIKNGEIYYLGATIITTDPKLGTLGNYGGYTQTIPILAGSSAIDAADDSVAPTTDQRGVSRPQGAHADIGAFESQGFTLAVAGGNGQSAAINTAFTNPLSVSLTANGAGEPVDGGSVTFTAPTTGASASLATSPATISNGAASVTATANGTSGSYQVTASAAGANSVNFALTNTLPEMDVEGNATPIADGDATPSTTDDTDFGSADIATGEADHTFTIKNTGNGDLNLTSDPKVKITGANAGDFTVAEQPASPVPGGSSVTFTVRFDPSATGIRTATISIANNDSNENPYDFAVRGTGTTRAPDIEVLGNGRSIANGAAAPDQGHHTDFGPVNIRTGSVEHTFTIQNNGTAEDLLLTGDPKVVISGDNAADFSITLQPSSPVSSAGTTTFQVKFDPGATGVRTATVSIASNDSDENPFEFTIQGTGTATPSNVVQIDVSSIFNKDVIANNGGTDRTLTAWDINGDATHDYVASGVAASWMTQSVANVHTGAPASQSDRNALPDYGLFPANADHPDVQLAYRNSDDGLNAYGSNAGDTTFSFTVPTGRYQKLQIFAASTYGSSTLSATFTYVGNSTQVQSDIKIEDWFQAPPPGGFTLIGSRDVLWYINGQMLIDLAAKSFPPTRGSLDEFLVSDRRNSYAGLDQTVEEFLFPEATVETIANLSKVAFKMLIRNPSMGSSNNILGVGNQPMYPRQESARVLRLAENHSAMFEAFLLSRFAVGFPSIGADDFQQPASLLRLSPAAHLLEEVLNGLCRGIIDDSHPCEAGSFSSLDIPIQGHCTQDGGFLLTTPSPVFAPGAKEGLVQLHQSCKLVPSVSISHCLSDLVRHHPRRLILPNLQDPLHLSHRNANLVHRHVVKQPIPLQQRSSGLVKDRSCRYTRAIPALLAVKKATLGQKPKLIVTASRTGKAHRPSLLCQMFGTRLLGKESLLKAQQAQLFISTRHLSPPIQEPT